MLKKDKVVQALFFVFILFTLLWVYLQKHIKTLDINEVSYDFYVTLFTGTYGLVALFGGALGVFISKKWGGINSVFGRAVLMFSIGLLAQELGQLIYFYYIYVLRLELPYPSLGDISIIQSPILDNNNVNGIHNIISANGCGSYAKF